MVLDVSRLLDESAKRSFRVGRPGEEQEPKAATRLVCVHPLPEGARRVAAAHRPRLDEQVRERGEEHGRSARKRPLRTAGFAPALVAGNEGIEPLLHCWPLEPGAHGIGAQLEEDTLTAVLHCG